MGRIADHLRTRKAEGWRAISAKCWEDHHPEFLELREFVPELTGLDMEIENYVQLCEFGMDDSIDGLLPDDEDNEAIARVRKALKMRHIKEGRLK